MEGADESTELWRHPVNIQTSSLAHGVVICGQSYKHIYNRKLGLMGYFQSGTTLES